MKGSFSTLLIGEKKKDLFSYQVYFLPSTGFDFTLCQQLTFGLDIYKLQQ